MKLFLAPVIILFLANFSSSHAIEFDKKDSVKAAFFRPAIDKLLLKGADTNFVKKLIANENTKFDNKYTKVNVYRRPSGFRDYTIDNSKSKYAHNYNAYSVKKAEKFLEENNEMLIEAEAKFGIPKEVITAILWVETRFGGYLGDNHVASVYISLAMAGEEEYFQKNKSELFKKYSRYKNEFPELEIMLKKRTDEKTDWAISQILALEMMQESSPVPVLEIRGSWAGAFGMSQFIPSSYVSWAVDGNSDGEVNLFDKEDAIYSVANYLSINGWGDSEKLQREAVFHYNHSNQYVDSVLLLADKISGDKEN